MKLYTFIYGDGVHEPLKMEEEMPFASFNEAVRHAKCTSLNMMEEQVGIENRDKFFVVVDDGKLPTWISFVDAARERAESISGPSFDLSN